jgi:hypothetical protein
MERLLFGSYERLPCPAIRKPHLQVLKSFFGITSIASSIDSDQFTRYFGGFDVLVDTTFSLTNVKPGLRPVGDGSKLV